MMPPPSIADELRLKRKLRACGRVVFETAWRIGTGKEGQTLSDLGVLLDAVGLPMLPGSSIKGKLRQTCESLAPALNLKTCLLNVQASGCDCTSDVRFYSQVREQHRKAVLEGAQQQLDWIEKNTCDVCKLFGSPVRAARLRCSDGKLENQTASSVRVRDGVVLDRDSHTAVDGLKYDYETVAAGTSFQVYFDLDNPAQEDEALFGAALFDWQAGSSIGGFTSRGLGRIILKDIEVFDVDFDNPQERIRYLTNTTPAAKLNKRENWENYFTEKIENVLNRTEGS